MNYYRITKYDPMKRDKSGKYMYDEWTSVSDVGKVYDGNMFTLKDYLCIEKRHVTCLIRLLEQAKVDFLQIEGLEEKNSCWQDGQILIGQEIKRFICSCLREQCWGKLVGRDFFIHFGYDYYTYIGTELDWISVEKTCRLNGLYAEKNVSPYLKS